MDRERARHVANTFVLALAHADVDGFVALFDPVHGHVLDSTNPGTLVGADAIRAHAVRLCQALQTARVTPLDVLADGDTAAIRWAAQAEAPGEHVMEAVTWLRLGPAGIEEARTFMDGAAFLWPTVHAEAPEDVSATREGDRLVLHAQDSRGVAFRVENMAGRVLCVLCASRRVQGAAMEMAEALGAAFGGNDKVALVLLLDGTDVPATLRPVARAALMAMRAQVVRRFHEGFARARRATPPHVEELAWLIPDFDGALFKGLGVSLPLEQPVMMVVDPRGHLAGQWKGTAAQVADAAIHVARGCALAAGST